MGILGGLRNPGKGWRPGKVLCFAIQTLSKRAWDVKQWALDVKYRGLGCQVWPDDLQPIPN